MSSISQDVGFLFGTLELKLLSREESEACTKLLEEAVHRLSPADCEAMLTSSLQASTEIAQAHLLASALHRALGFFRWQRLIFPWVWRFSVGPQFVGLPPAMKRLILAAYEDRYAKNPLEILSRLENHPGARRMFLLLAGERAPKPPTPTGSSSNGSEKENAASVTAQLRSSLEKRRGAYFWQTFHGRSKEERESIVAAYDAAFAPRTLLGDLKRRHRKLDAEILSDLVRDGSVQSGKLLFYSVAGIGTDEALARMILRQTSGEALSELMKSFRTSWEVHAPWHERLFPRWFGDIKRRLFLECGGDSWFDLSRYFQSEQRSSDAQLRHWFTYEQSGWLMRFLAPRCRDGQILGARFQRLQETPSEIRRQSLRPAVENDLEIFRDTKHLLGNALTIACTAPLATLVLLSLAAFDLPLWEIMIGVGLASATSRLFVKRAVKGRGYHREELVVDLCCAALDGLTLFANRLFRHFLLRSSTRFLTKIAFRMGFSRALQPAVLLQHLSAEARSGEFERSTPVLELAGQSASELLARAKEKISLLAPISGSSSETEIC